MAKATADAVPLPEAPAATARTGSSWPMGRAHTVSELKEYSRWNDSRMSSCRPQ